MNKQDLREQAILHRDRIRPEDEDVENMSFVFFGHVKPKKGQVVAGFWSKEKELNTAFLIDDLFKEAMTVALPVVEKGRRELTFRTWDGKADLVKGAFGVFEPPESGETVIPDIVMVPFLAFDRRGYRLGYGGGYYDATLEKLRSVKEILAVGVGYAAQAVLFNLPTEPHDQPLDLIVTPNGAHDFR
jgi:5-formyltetrahydrofolate cyclo-ligase